MSSCICTNSLSNSLSTLARSLLTCSHLACRIANVSRARSVFPFRSQTLSFASVWHLQVFFRLHFSHFLRSSQRSSRSMLSLLVSRETDLLFLPKTLATSAVCAGTSTACHLLGPLNFLSAPLVVASRVSADLLLIRLPFVRAPRGSRCPPPLTDNETTCKNCRSLSQM